MKIIIQLIKNSNGNPILDEEFSEILNDFTIWKESQELVLKKLF